MSKKKYRIGIDGRFWGIKHAGLGRYTKNLVLNLIQLIKQEGFNIEIVLFANTESLKKDSHLLKNIETVACDISHYSFKEQLQLSRVFDKQKLDLIHIPHFNAPIFLKTPRVITIHDLIKHYFRGKTVTTRNILYYYVKYFAYRLAISQNIKKSKQIIVPSDFVKRQIMQNYPKFLASHINIVYEAVDSQFLNCKYKDFEYLKKKFHIKDRYFIYTGSVYAHKNIEVLLRSFKRLLKNSQFQNIQLFIVCGRDVFWQRLKSMIAKFDLVDNVMMPGRVSDQDLANLYHYSLAFIFPSLMEGFGLPGLEAMACETLVISSKTGSLPEIYKDAALYFNPKRSGFLYKLLLEVLHFDTNKRQEYLEKGKQVVKQYSWQKTAQETLQVYENCLSL